MSKPRDYLIEPGLILHVYNRGVDRAILFRGPRFFEMFMQKLMEAKERANVSIFLHTLMSNHFHLMLQQHEPFAISAFMQYVCNAFSRWSNKRLKRTGPLYDSPYGATPVPTAEAFLRIMHYILTNPVQAGLVDTPDRWRYSSCRALLDGTNDGCEDYSLPLGLVGGPELMAHFLDDFCRADPISAQDYLSPDYEKIWDDRTCGEFLRYEGEKRRAEKLKPGLRYRRR